MITIKGGVKILPNSDNKEFMDKLKQAGVTVKMPFTAKSFKSTKTPKGFDVTAVVETPKIKEVKSTPKTTKPKTVKPKKKSILNRLKKTK